MDITADFINRLYKLGATAADQTYGYINIGSALAPLNNMGTNVQQPFDAPGGFFVTNVWDDTTTGFRIAFYKNSDTHEILITPNGSDGWTAKDWSSNGLYTGYNQWKENAKRVMDDLRAMVQADPSVTINISGHSLGGAEAQYTLAELLKERQKPTYTVINKQTGESSEVANPLYQFPPDKITLQTYASPGVGDILAQMDPAYNPNDPALSEMFIRHYTSTGELVNQIGGNMVGGGGMVYYLTGNGSMDIGYTHRLPNSFYDGYINANGDMAALEAQSRVTLSTAKLQAIGNSVAMLGGNGQINSSEGLVRLGIAVIVGSALDMTGELAALVRAGASPYIGDGLASLAGAGAEVLMKALLITNPIAWVEAVVGGIIGANLLHIGASTPTPDELANLGFTPLRDGFTRLPTQTLDDGKGGQLTIVTDQAQGILHYQVRQQNGQIWTSDINPSGETMQLMNPADPSKVLWQVRWPVDKPYAEVYNDGQSLGKVYPDQLTGVGFNADGREMNILLKHSNTTTELKYTVPASGENAIGIYVNGNLANFDAQLKQFSYSLDGLKTEKYTSWQEGVDIINLLDDGGDSNLLQMAAFSNIDLSKPLYRRSVTDTNSQVVEDEEKSLVKSSDGKLSIKTTTRTFANENLLERIEKQYTEEVISSGATQRLEMQTVYFGSRQSAQIFTKQIDSEFTQTVTTQVGKDTVVLTYRSTDGSEPVLDDVLMNGKAPTNLEETLTIIKEIGLVPDDFLHENMLNPTTEKMASLESLTTVYADHTPSAMQNLINGFNATTDAISTYGPSIIDALSLIKAIQSGEPLPIVASGLRLANDIDRWDGKSDLPGLNGAATVASGILSIMSLDAALKTRS